MQKKKTSMILAAVLIIVSLTGCGGYGNKMEDKTNVNSISNSQSTGVTSDINEGTYNSINDLHITYNNNFNDGYAWIGVANSDNRYRAGYYIDKSGNVYPEFNIGSNFDLGKEWKGGTVCASNMIYNAKGETIFKTDDTYTDILAYGDGYYMIAKNVHDMTTDKDVICFLSTEGKWLDFSVDLGKSIYYKECGYLGEGIFYAENKYINVKTKKSIDIQYDGIKYGGGSIIGQFLNGVAVASDGNLIYSNGTVKKTGVEGKIRGSVSDGGFVYTNQIDVNGKFNDEMTYVYFYDISKGKSYLITTFMEGVKIQKQVTTGTNYNYRFENGSLFLALTGVDGETYLNCFDKSGNKLMEPKSFGSGKIGERACGRLVAQTRDRAITIYDDKCNIILETKEYRVSNQIETLSYSDDCLAVCDNNYENINYIDKDGNLLFAKGLLDENLKKVDYKKIAS